MGLSLEQKRIPAAHRKQSVTFPFHRRRPGPPEGRHSAPSRPLHSPLPTARATASLRESPKTTCHAPQPRLPPGARRRPAAGSPGGERARACRAGRLESSLEQIQRAGPLWQRTLFHSLRPRPIADLQRSCGFDLSVQCCTQARVDRSRTPGAQQCRAGELHEMRPRGQPGGGTWEGDLRDSA